MNIAILHLSDLHIQSGHDVVMGRIASIKSAILSTQCQIDACLVLVTGDIAFSGAKEQYTEAQRFFSEVNVAIRAIDSRITVHFFFVPGNHDCSFPADDDLRVMVLNGVAKDIDALDPNGSAVKSLLQVQQNFFAFLQDSSQLSVPPVPAPSLYWEYHVPLDRRTVKICCYNTAFMSRLGEVQGQLYFPPCATPQQSDFAHDLVVAVFHHPCNWLESNNARTFESHIQATADVVLTGHQHAEASSVVCHLSGETFHYLAGGVLQESATESSSFNLVICDLIERKQRVFQFDWNGTSYVSPANSDWKPLTRNTGARREFIISPQFADQLLDIGLGIQHPRKKNLILRDVFIYPDIDVLSGTGNSVTAVREIASEKLLSAVLKTEKVVILGGDFAGKSALARVLFSDLSSHGFVPVMLPGNELGTGTADALTKKLNARFEEQYSSAHLDAYKRLDKSKKVLIVDDWHRAGTKVERQSALLRHAESLCGKVILLADDLYQLSEVRSPSPDNPLREFDHWEIRQFGYALRHQLVRKWHLIGSDRDDGSNDFLHEIDEDVNLIESVLGKNLLPSYPGTILLLLHTRLSSKSVGAMNGAYGYLFEALISTALARVSGGDPTNIDTKYTVLSRLAHHIFKKEKYSFTKSEVEQVVKAYFDAYEVRISAETFLEELEQSQVVTLLDGNYRFRYRYYFYFFVARYYQENLRAPSPDPTLLQELKEMVDFVYCDDYSNILMFVVYLTRSPELFEHILSSSYALFGSRTACDFDKDVDFFNKLNLAPIEMLPDAGVVANREQYNQQKDAHPEGAADDAHNDKLSYCEDLDDIIKLNIALKNLQLMGQVVRNFAGSIRKEQKIDFLRASYALGLRILNAGLSMMKENDEEFRRFLARIIHDERGIDDPKKLASKVDEAVSYFARRLGFGVLKRVSYSVGARILEPSYESLLQEEENRVGFEMIDLSVKLDHFRRFPEDEIRALWKRFQKNVYSASVVQELVWHHFYLFNVERQTRQSISTLLGFKAETPSLLTNRSKMSRPELKSGSATAGADD